MPGHISGNHADKDGDNSDSSLPCGNTEIEDKPTHDANIDVSQGTTGMEGPLAHTRSDGIAPSSGVSLLQHGMSKHTAEVISASPQKQEPAKWLQTLTLVERPLFESKAIHIGKDCLVSTSRLLA